jgi:Tat protein translocase TatB subunit
MFDVGFSELLIIAVVALLVLGPERLPHAARFAGLWVRRARAQWESVRAELERELEGERLKSDLDAAAQGVQAPIRELQEAAARDRGGVAARPRATAATGRRHGQAVNTEAEAGDSLVSHLLELRSRLLRAVVAVLVAFLAVLPFSDRLYAWLAQPLLAVLPAGGKLVAIEVTSTFFVPLRLSFFAALMLAMPVVLYQLWAFVAPGCTSMKSAWRGRCWWLRRCCSTPAAPSPIS